MGDRWAYRQAMDYNNYEEILAVFPQLGNINGLLDKGVLEGCQGIIIRSANDDNVHKAIKYRVWTTTQRNRVKIDHCWEKAKHSNTYVYLFFSVVKSGMFQGVARLKSSYHEQIFPYWWQNHTQKFKGYFQLEWVFLKDVNYKHFEGITNCENIDVTKSKDCDVVDNQNTLKMMEVFQNKQAKRWIFNDFAYMDDREKNYTRRMVEQAYYGAEYQQQYYNNYAQPQQEPLPINPLAINPMIMQYPPQSIMRPVNGTALGFEMNPVSNKNRKKGS